jgi:hypothetical protein
LTANNLSGTGLDKSREYCPTVLLSEYKVGDKVGTELGIGAAAAVTHCFAKISSSRICIKRPQQAILLFYEVYGESAVVTVVGDSKCIIYFIPDGHPLNSNAHTWRF